MTCVIAGLCKHGASNKSRYICHEHHIYIYIYVCVIVMVFRLDLVVVKSTRPIAKAKQGHSILT